MILLMVFLSIMCPLFILAIYLLVQEHRERRQIIANIRARGPICIMHEVPMKEIVCPHCNGRFSYGELE